MPDLNLAVVHQLLAVEHERGKRVLSLACGPKVVEPGAAGLPSYVTGWNGSVTCVPCRLARAIAR